MNEEERARLMKHYGFRPGFEWSSRIPISIGVVLTSCLLFGAWVAVFGPTAGERLIGGVMLLVGAVGVRLGLKHFARPVAPKNDADFAREIERLQEADRED